MTERADVRAWVGLGSNLDNPPSQLQRALLALDKLPHTRVLRHSSLYLSAPWGIADQPAFVNAVAELRTSLEPRTLLDSLLAIERVQGRRRDGTRWGPRTLDLDLLSYADHQSSEPDLILPHPHIAERAFVLLPWAELDAGTEIPGAGVVRDLLARLDAHDCVPLDDSA
ncbi:MAG: 2-amino-4-hydroxy-6-hydroxymethyldihydropteridine diphosphokinase [Dokdonella sp.]